MFNYFRVLQRKQGRVTTVCQQGGRVVDFLKILIFEKNNKIVIKYLVVYNKFVIFAQLFVH